MRLLDKDAGKQQTSDLGMPEKTKEQLLDLISRPHGIILVTGPTGSGKTTTLYSALQQMDRQAAQYYDRRRSGGIRSSRYQPDAD